VEYVDAILADLQTLGVKPHKITYTSDYFDIILQKAEQVRVTIACVHDVKSVSPILFV
jgi:hypothetical protein